MVEFHAVADQAHASNPVALAHASIPVPPSLAYLGKARHEIFLRPTPEGHCRWFHADGSKTVVEGDSIEHAIHIAQIVWRDVQLLAD